MDFELEIEIKLAEIASKELELQTFKKELDLLRLRLRKQKGEKSSELNNSPVKDSITPNTGTIERRTDDLRCDPKVNKRPNTGTGLFDEEDRAKYYYVVFNGPNAGIYDSWPAATDAIHGFSGISWKKYKTKEEAERAQKQWLGPRTYSSALKEDKPFQDKKTVLGTIPKVNPSRQRIPEPRFPILKAEAAGLFDMNIENWIRLHNEIRLHDGSTMRTDRYYTTDREDTGSKVIILQGADPKMVYKLFLAGLVEAIYMSDQLAEISLFPLNIKRALVYYQKRVAQGRPVFMKIWSTIPDWEDGKIYTPYSFIKIGVSSGSASMANPKCLPARIPDLIELAKERAAMLAQQFNQLQRITRESEIKVNYTSNKIIIISMYNKTIPEEDFTMLTNWEIKYYAFSMEISEFTKREGCRMIQNSPDHLCDYCRQTTWDEHMEEEEKSKCCGKPEASIDDSEDAIIVEKD
ncbi:hypothetical protein V6N13_145521 [Hibiscus sabdariffa]